MTKFFLRKIVLVLAMVGATISFEAKASPLNSYYSIEFCTGCVDDAGFKAYAEGVVSGFNSGEWTILVTNPTTLESRVVWVRKERDMGYSSVMSTAFPAPPDVQARVVAAIELFELGEFVAPIPGGPGRDDYASHTQEGVGDAIRQTPELMDLLVNDWFDIVSAVTNLFGRHLIAIVIFPNGDVAKFKVINAAGHAAGCCVYIEGSARDADGNVLDDRPPEGGSNYVGGGGGPSTGGPITVRYRASGWMGGWRNISCTKPVGSDRFECHDV